MPIPKRDIENLRVLAKCLSRNPHRVDEIQTIFGLSERTAYRWLKYLGELGLDIVKRGTDEGVVYSILAPHLPGGK